MTTATTTKSESLWGVGSVNMLLQGLTLGSKALLLLGLALYLTPAQLGVFGLLTVTLTLSLYLVGLDFYAFNTRELLKGNRQSAPARIRDQFVFHGVTYLVAFPLLLLVFFWDVLPWSLAALFFALLLLEHVAQEIQRILITLHRSVHAAALLFLRGGVWVYAVLGLMAFSPYFRTVETVAIAWAASVAISLVAGWFCLNDLPWASGTHTPVDWAWLRRGIAVSLPFLCASLAFRGLVSADRFALDRYMGTEAVGVYTLYSGVRNAIQSLLDLGVVAVIRPRVVQAYQTGDLPLYRARMRHMTKAIGGLSFILCALSAFAIWPILALVDNPIYDEHVTTYWLLLGVTLVTALADIPHTTLYARHQDREIVISSLIGLVVAVAGNVLLVPRIGLPGAALATLLALLVFGGLKAFWAAQGEAVA